MVFVLLLGRRRALLVCKCSNEDGNLYGQIHFKTTSPLVSSWHLQAKEQRVDNFLPAAWCPLLCKPLGCLGNVRTHQPDAPASCVRKNGPEYGCSLHGRVMPSQLVAEAQLCAHQPQMALVKRFVGVYEAVGLLRVVYPPNHHVPVRGWNHYFTVALQQVDAAQGYHITQRARPPEKSLTVWVLVHIFFSACSFCK